MQAARDWDQHGPHARTRGCAVTNCHCTLECGCPFGACVTSTLTTRAGCRRGCAVPQAQGWHSQCVGSESHLVHDSDLVSLVCPFLVVGIHSRPAPASSERSKRGSHLTLHIDCAEYIYKRLRVYPRRTWQPRYCRNESSLRRDPRCFLSLGRYPRRRTLGESQGREQS